MLYTEKERAIKQRVSARRDRILGYVKSRGVVTPQQISEALELSRATLSVDLVALRESGKLRNHLGIIGVWEAVEK